VFHCHQLCETTESIAFLPSLLLLLCIPMQTLVLDGTDVAKETVPHICESCNCVLLQLLFAEEGLSQWQWYRSTSPRGSSAPSISQSADHGQEGQQPQAAAEFEGFAAIAGATGRLYVPAQTDDGCILRVQCTPGSRCVFSHPCTAENPCRLIDNRPLVLSVCSQQV